MLLWLSLSSGKYYTWQKRKDVAAKKKLVPKSHYLLPWERQAIIDYRHAHPDEGYRRLAYMMLDENIVAVSPSSVYRELKQAGLLLCQWRKRTKAKGQGFKQPSGPHQQWHLDVSYINFKGTFVYLVVLIDGYSRYIVQAELRMSVEALDVEILLERAREKFPGVQPALITDNGPQFVSREFKGYLDMVGITHRRTRFYYPQSNGTVERYMQTCKNESVSKSTALDLDELKEQIADYVEFYNRRRLHSSLGYVAPLAMLQGRQEVIFKERQHKMAQARLARGQHHQESNSGCLPFAVLATKMRSEEQNQDRTRFSVCAEGKS